MFTPVLTVENEKDLSKELTQSVIEVRGQDACLIAEQLLQGGSTPSFVAAAGERALAELGERFARGEAFVPDLVMAGEIMRGIIAQARPYLRRGVDTKELGVVVLATVKGDVHDIGKGLVAVMLDNDGFDVVDLGVDVPSQAIVDEVRELQPRIVGLSGLLTATANAMRATIAALAAAGVRDRVRVMIGGASVTKDVCAHVGADGWAPNAVAAVALAEEWVTTASPPSRSLRHGGD